jgi:predicted phosphodiesterase
VAQKRIYLSDLHVGGGGRADDFGFDAETAFVQLVYDTPDAEFVLVGDIFELWQFGSQEIRNAHPAFFTVLERIRDRLVLIPGNHDMVLDWMQGYRIERSYYVVDGVLSIHGHQHDRYNRAGSRSIGRLITGFLGYVEKAGWENVDEVLGGLWRKISTRRQSYEQFLETIASARGVDGVIYGHIHMPYGNTLESGLHVYNCGMWTTDFVHGYPYILQDSGKIVLKWTKGDSYAEQVQGLDQARA